jgi:bla regulator protein blaR1
VRSHRLPLIVLAIVAATASTSAQTTTGEKPSFEVASIKPSKPGMRQRIMIQPGDRFVANGVSLMLLIAIAYHLQAFQLSGGESWMSNDQWSIEAEAAEGTVDPPSPTPTYMGVPQVMALRLQSLLTDRFELKAHHEERQLQVYALTVSKDGLKLKAVNPPPVGSSQRPDAAPQGKQPPVRPEGASGSISPPPGAVLAAPGTIIGSAVGMDQIVTLLGRLMDRPVIDETGLKGYFDVRLQYDPETTPRPAFGAGPTAGSTLAPMTTGDPSIFTAIQEQLGLKLESTKKPVDVLVIDSAQEPSGN